MQKKVTEREIIVFVRDRLHRNRSLNNAWNCIISNHEHFDTVLFSFEVFLELYIFRNFWLLKWPNMFVVSSIPLVVVFNFFDYFNACLSSVILEYLINLARCQKPTIKKRNQSVSNMHTFGGIQITSFRYGGLFVTGTKLSFHANSTQRNTTPKHKAVFFLVQFLASLWSHSYGRDTLL